MSEVKPTRLLPWGPFSGVEQRKWKSFLDINSTHKWNNALHWEKEMIPVIQSAVVTEGADEEIAYDLGMIRFLSLFQTSISMKYSGSLIFSMSDSVYPEKADNSPGSDWWDPPPRFAMVKTTFFEECEDYITPHSDNEPKF